MSDYVPCPVCGGSYIQKVRYTFWGGLLGPWMFNHVKCATCGHKY